MIDLISLYHFPQGIKTPDMNQSDLFVLKTCQRTLIVGLKQSLSLKKMLHYSLPENKPESNKVCPHPLTQTLHTRYSSVLTVVLNDKMFYCREERNARNRNSEYTKILSWSSMYGDFTLGMGSLGKFPFQDCKYSKCLLTSDRYTPDNQSLHHCY